MEDSLITLRKDVSDLLKQVRAEQGDRISKIEIRRRAETVAKNWLHSIEPMLRQSSKVDGQDVDRRTNSFRRLIKLSGPNNRKSSYLSVLADIQKGFRDELILPSQLAPRSVPGTFLGFNFDALDANESVYLQEALDCAKHKFYRAAVVLGWCAAINRIHKRIEQIGFAAFNSTSDSMARQTVGRFKKFSARQSVSSLSELRLVFDTVVLWIAEGMGLIDSNQHARLFSCFEMRNHSAHPGEAPITEYNLASVFSDLNEIVFKNPKFKVS